MKSSTNRYTPAEKPPINRAALATMALNTGCTSPGELAMTFNISAVTARCSQASFSSSPKPGALERFEPTTVGAALRLVLPGVRPVAERALRVFAALALPPVLDDRAISAPKGQYGQLIKPNLYSGRGRTNQNRCRCRLWVQTRKCVTTAALVQ